jgi:hypothetical protein
MSTEAIVIRDAIMARLQAKSYFSTFNTSTNKSLQIQPHTIPFLGVYLIEETNLPDGDINVGEVRFRCFTRYGISVIVQNIDGVAAETELDNAMAVINELFKDPTLYNWSGKYGPVKIQGFARGGRSHVFGSIGLDNELPIAELRFDLNCDLGTLYYEYEVPDYLHTIHIKTQFPSGATQAEIDSVQQVQAEWIIWEMLAPGISVTRPVLGSPTLGVI